ncbi:MAG: transposase [Saezia sp.]
MRTRNSAYPLEFRQQLVELVQAGRKPSDLAKEFGCHETTISGWVRQAQIDQAPNPKANGSLTSAERQELVMLRRQLREVQQERDILAKATAWFANKNSINKTSTR